MAKHNGDSVKNGCIPRELKPIVQALEDIDGIGSVRLTQSWNECGKKQYEIKPLCIGPVQTGVSLRLREGNKHYVFQVIAQGKGQAPYLGQKVEAYLTQNYRI